MKQSESSFSIAAVEREVGISKELLRVWERRYGFPSPERDPRGERAYPAEQVRRLALVKRLMDRGHRPGKLLRMAVGDLEAQAAAASGTHRAGGDAQAIAALVQLVRARDTEVLEEALQRRLAGEGLERFVLDTVGPMATQVGLDWACGELHVHQEHLFTELVQRVLRQAVAQLPRGLAPRVLLTTVPDEPHALGLMMLEALLALHGARCINLGPRLPLLEIARAARDHRVQVVALSFSSAFPARQAASLVQQLRSMLAADQQLWIGGAGAARLAPLEGVRRLAGLDAAVAAVHGWPRED